ncbi:LOG family protein [Saccharicrinis fermentans]|uniref:Cytokinin riboside 5'-monophosphate phosphoribohydrolase n=1 Tax=Saccharicrinis fermentans DSM 9555 = JCM 21142 TaxID=869213 RepID=W7Y3F2_9BACT|nr:TIGR00730 family Rossman fold protein [Saccharicrinis fermentans]GAF05385.1 LOG family protein YvdD [Saccharicrinis fermentans DSM 9555 = JCM 21142]
MGKKVCVFCASSSKIDRVYMDAAVELGKVLVKEGLGIKYGGGGLGLMGAVADSVLACGGEVTGVIPRFMVEVEWEHKGVKDMVHVDTMAQRKELLVKEVEAVITLPGGTGTMEELFEVLSSKKLGLFNKPVVLLNTKGFFDPLIQMIRKMIDQNFMREEHGTLWTVINEPGDVMKAIKNSRKWPDDPMKIATF